MLLSRGEFLMHRNGRLTVVGYGRAGVGILIRASLREVARQHVCLKIELCVNA